jgi:hypothetical protein
VYSWAHSGQEDGSRSAESDTGAAVWSDRRVVRNSRRNDQARKNVSARVTEDSSANVPLAERIQSILSSKGLTLYRVSQQSAALYGQSSPYFLPHNLYYDLRVGSFIPSIHQITALSRISGYRLADWLRVFGFSLEDITRLQVLLPPKRTILLDTSLTDSDDWVSWFQNRHNAAAVLRLRRLGSSWGRQTPSGYGCCQSLASEVFCMQRSGSRMHLRSPTSHREASCGSIQCRRS